MEGPRFAGLPARCVPPSGFGYPPDGLLPSRPWPAFFRADSARGIRPSELPPSKRYSTRFRVEEPTYCLFPPVYPLPKHRAGWAGRSSWVLVFSKSLATYVCLARRPLAAPLGFCLRGPFTKTLAGISPNLLSRAFCPAEAGQRRLRVSIGLRFSLILRSHKCKRS